MGVWGINYYSPPSIAQAGVNACGGGAERKWGWLAARWGGEKEGRHRAFGQVQLISCHDDSKGVGAPGWEAARDMLVLNHGDSTSVELLRCCCGNQWDQIAEEIYNYYKPDPTNLAQ